MTSNDVGKLLAIIRAAWPQSRIGDPDATAKAYELGLRDVPYADAEIAVQRCIEELTFMPTVAEIRERLPKKPGLDSRLYRAFAALHGRPRTGEEERQFQSTCRRLGIEVPSAPRRELAPPREVSECPF